MLKFVLLLNTLVCPPTKMNIIGPMTKQDVDAHIEHKMQCVGTKSWPCLIEFVKKDTGGYSSKCGEMVEKINTQS